MRRPQDRSPLPWPLTIDDLTTDADGYRHIAHQLMAGDAIRDPWSPRHGRRDIWMKNTEGYSKLRTYRAMTGRKRRCFHKTAKQAKGYPYKKPYAACYRIQEDREVFDLAERVRLYQGYKVPILCRVASWRRLLLPYQLGGVSKLDIDATRFGKARVTTFTNCDLIARTIQEHAFKGYHFALSADLRKAYDRIDRRAVLEACFLLTGHQTTAKWLARSVRPRFRYRLRDGSYGRPHNRKDGIEQGGVLSALLLNVALAPALKRLQDEFDVIPLTYIDDLVFLCRTEKTTHAVYARFVEILQETGIGSIRALDDSTGKASKIVDLRNQPLEILGGYSITHDSVGVSDELWDHFTEEDHPNYQTYSLRRLKKELNMKALDNRALRVRRAKAPSGQRLVRTAHSRGGDSKAKGDGNLKDREAYRADLPAGGTSGTEVRNRRRHDHVDTLYKEKKHTVDPKRNPGRTHNSIESGGTSTSCHVCTTAPDGANDRGHQSYDQGIPRPPDQRVGDGSRGLATASSASSPDEHSRPMDLGGIREELGPQVTDREIKKAIKDRLRGHHENRKVVVRVDPRKRLHRYLGGDLDPKHSRLPRREGDGFDIVRLQRKRRLAERRVEKPAKQPLPSAALLIERLKYRKAGFVQMRVRDDTGNFRWLPVPINNPACSVVAYDALHTMLRHRRPETLAISTTLVPALMLVDDSEWRPRNAIMAQAVNRLRKHWDWEQRGDWLLGTPKPNGQIRGSRTQRSSQ